MSENMKPVLFTAEFSTGRPWSVALEHDPGTVTSSHSKGGKPVRWTGAATRLYLGPVYFCLVWGASK